MDVFKEVTDLARSDISGVVECSKASLFGWSRSIAGLRSDATPVPAMWFPVHQKAVPRILAKTLRNSLRNTSGDVRSTGFGSRELPSDTVISEPTEAWRSLSP